MYFVKNMGCPKALKTRFQEYKMSEFLAAVGSIHPILVCLIVCAAKIIEITIQALKTCMMVKGQRLKAAMLGFVECTVWGLVISTIIGTLGDNLFLLAFYCCGYATGLFLGSTLEGKIALGTSSLELIVNEEKTEIILEYLKQNSRGYTVFPGHGAKESMNMIFVVLPRRDVVTVSKQIRKLCDNSVFMVVDDVNKYTGGYGMIK